MILIKVLTDGANGGVYVIILLIRALVNDHQSTPVTTRAGNQGKTKPSFVQPKPFWWPITKCVLEQLVSLPWFRIWPLLAGLATSGGTKEPEMVGPTDNGNNNRKPTMLG